MKSLRGRLIFWLILGITLFLATNGFAIHAIVSSQMRRNFDRGLLTTARSIGPMLRREMAQVTGRAQTPAPLQVSLSTRPDLLFELRTPGGESLLRSESFGDQDLPAFARGLAPTGPAMEELQHLLYADVSLPPDGRSGRALAFVLGRPAHVGLGRPARRPELDRPGRPGRPDPDAGGGRRADGRPGRRSGLDEPVDLRGVEVVLAGDTTELLSNLRSLRLLLALAWLSCSLGSAAILSWVVHRSLRPLGRLSSQIEGLSGDRLQKRFVLPDAPAELEPVVAELNLLLERIQGAFDREQAFTADAAHELRTPLAGLRSTLELALSRERETHEYRRAAASSLAITEEMQTLVGDLLQLSRMASSNVELQRQDLLVAESFERARDRFADEARGRGLKFEAHIDAGLTVRTDRALLERVLHNLVENAVAYADEGTEVELRASGHGAGINLEITNLATGAPADLPQKAFLAFWRADGSRSMVERHAGLGLSLCLRIVQQLGGSMHATLDAGRFTVRVSLPG